MNTPDSQPTVTPSCTSPTTSAPERTEPSLYLPSVHLLPSPDALLRRPPYHLLVTHAHNSPKCIRIQCEHSPSLGFLEEYFQKWCRQNSQRVDKPKLVQVTLSRSPYGGEDLHDMLTLEYPSGSGFSCVPPALSVPIVLHLVESVLGYRLVYQDATNWHYRRDTPLMRM
ncbi:hypothetical protein E4U23_002429 [Claviceps purpurea]|nr:hypothetical protein E4U23_002429 [Claviceps purpurea]